MYDHIALVQQRWDSGPGDSRACWIALDYSNAYDSVSHSMMTALFRYINIPDPWIRVLCQILLGHVLFLVGGDVAREEQPLPSSGIRQGDPLSPIFFPLLTSHIVFVLRRHGLEVWLCSHDALVRISCLWTVLTQTVQSVLDDFTEFGAVTCLRLNLHKMKALLQGVGPWPVQLSRI